MKALTICQPYAALIVGGPGVRREDLKRVENRTWFMRYRGRLLIHAGVSRKWLGTWCADRMPKDMPFGAIVGFATVIACVSKSIIENRRGDLLPVDLRWLRSHRHAEGPQCIVLDQVQRLLEPIPCAGKQGLWDFPIDEPTLLAAGGFVPAEHGCEG